MLLPSKQLNLTSKLDLSELKARLERNLEPRKLRFTRPKSHKLFAGKLAGNEFDINRIISYRNSFLPMIKGRLIANTNGTQIQIKMTLHAFSRKFLFFFIGITASMAVLTISNMFAEGSFELGGLVPLGMTAFALTLGHLGFLPESKRAEVLLRELFEAESLFPGQ